MTGLTAALRAGLELALFLLLGGFIDALLFGWSGFAAVIPSPWWGVVLVVAWRHGTVFGLVAAMLATLEVGYAQGLFTASGWMGLSLSSRAIGEPLAWLVMAVLVGELRRRDRARFVALSLEARGAQSAQQRAFADAEILRKRNEDLLGQLQAQTDVAQFSYGAIRQLEHVTSETLGDWIQDVVIGVLHPRCFSIFFLDHNGLRRGLVWGAEDDNLTPARYDKDSVLYREVIEQGRVLCVADPGEAVLMENYGVLAGPIRTSSQGRVIGLIKIESMAFSRLNAYAIASVRMVGEWIGAAVTELRHARHGSQASNASAGELVPQQLMRQPLTLIDGLAKRIGFAVSLVVVELRLLDDLDSESRHTVSAVVAGALGHLRSTDYWLASEGAGGRYTAVLPKTTEEEANAVVRRIKSIIQQELPPPLKDIPISLRVEPWSRKTYEAAALTQTG